MTEHEDDRHERLDEPDAFDAFDRDDELRAMLRDADPARSLPPADPAGLAHLLEDIMSTDLDIRPAAPEEGTRAAGTRGRNPLTWLVAAAAAAVIAGAGGFALSGLGDDDQVPQATDQPTSAGPTTDLTAPVEGTTELTAAAAGGRCAVPSPELLGATDQAFAGTVTAIEGDTVTIETAEVYAGQVGETVQVTAPAPELRALIQAASFQIGGTYLVAASDGQVGVCGLTGKATGELRSLYEKAFVR